MVQSSNLLHHPYTLKKGTHIVNFSILTPEQTKHIRPVNPTSVRHLLNNNNDDSIHYTSSLLKTSKTDEINETYWFPTQQNPGNEKEHTPFQTRILHVPNVNGETRHKIPDEVTELSIPETHLDRQTHTHHMVTGQTAQTNQIIEFLPGRISTPRKPPSHQHQNLSTQVSQDNDLPMVQQIPRNQNSDANNSNNRLGDEIAGIANQQRTEAATMLKTVSTNTLIFDGKNEKFELFEDLFHTLLKLQPKMTEAMKIMYFHAHLRKEALQTFRNLSASNKCIKNSR